MSRSFHGLRYVSNAKPRAHHFSHSNVNSFLGQRGLRLTYHHRLLIHSSAIFFFIEWYFLKYWSKLKSQSTMKHIPPQMQQNMDHKLLKIWQKQNSNVILSSNTSDQNQITFDPQNPFLPPQPYSEQTEILINNIDYHNYSAFQSNTESEQYLQQNSIACVLRRYQNRNILNIHNIQKRSYFDNQSIHQSRNQRSNENHPRNNTNHPKQQQSYKNMNLTSKGWRQTSSLSADGQNKNDWPSNATHHQRKPNYNYNRNDSNHKQQNNRNFKNERYPSLNNFIKSDRSQTSHFNNKYKYNEQMLNKNNDSSDDKLSNIHINKWQEMKIIDINSDVTQKELRGMRYRQINQCFDDDDSTMNINDKLLINSEIAMEHYFDFDHSFETNAEDQFLTEEEKLKQDQSMKRNEEYIHHTSYLNNNYDDDHFNLFTIHHFLQRIMHRDMHGNVILRISREWERPSLLCINGTHITDDHNQRLLSMDNASDARLLRYYIDMYFVRFSAVSKMMLTFKSHSNTFSKKLKVYLSLVNENTGEHSTAEYSLKQKEIFKMESEIGNKHKYLISIKKDIYRHMHGFGDAIRIPDEFLLNAEDAFNIKEELLTEILPLYFLSGIGDVPLQFITDHNMKYSQHLKILHSYYFPETIESETEDIQLLRKASVDSAINDYLLIISNLLKLEDYDHFQSEMQNQRYSQMLRNTNDIQFDSYPKLALHLITTLEQKYPQRIYPRNIYRLIRVLCKKIEIFGYDQYSNSNELIRICLKKLALHSPDFFNNLSFYHLLSMTYINIQPLNENETKMDNDIYMNNMCNKLLQLKYQMMGGSINVGDLCFICGNYYLLTWLETIRSNTIAKKHTKWSDFQSSIALLPLSVLGYDGTLAILLKFIDNHTYVHRIHGYDCSAFNVTINGLVDDIFNLYDINHQHVQHIEQYMKYHRNEPNENCAEMNAFPSIPNRIQSWTLYSALNFVIKRVSEFSHQTNQMFFNSEQMLQLIHKINKRVIELTAKSMVFDLNAIKRAICVSPTSNEAYDAFLDEWFAILCAKDMRYRENTYLLLPLSNSVSLVERYHDSIFNGALKRTMRYDKKCDYRMLSNVQCFLCPLIFFNSKTHASSSHMQLVQSTARVFNGLERDSEVTQQEIIIDIMLESLLMCNGVENNESNHESDNIAKYFLHEWCPKLYNNQISNKNNDSNIKLSAECMFVLKQFCLVDEIQSSSDTKQESEHAYQDAMKVRSNALQQLMIDRKQSIELHKLVHKVFINKLHRRDMHNMVEFFTNCCKIAPHSFKATEIDQVMHLCRKLRMPDLALSVFESTRCHHNQQLWNGTTVEIPVTQNVLSCLIMTLMENSRLDAAKYWMQRFLDSYPILSNELYSTFFAQYLTYDLSQERSRRCEGRDRQILKTFYDGLLINHYKIHPKNGNQTHENMTFSNQLLFTLECSPNSLNISYFSMHLNTYRSRIESIEAAMVQLMYDNKISEMKYLLKWLFINVLSLKEENQIKINPDIISLSMDIFYRTYFQIFRFISNHSEFLFILQLFKVLNLFSGKNRSGFALTSAKIELLFDDECKNMATIKDFECLKKSEKSRKNMNVSHISSDIQSYIDPNAHILALLHWCISQQIIVNKHCLSIVIHKMKYFYLIYDEMHSSLNSTQNMMVSHDIHIRFAHYFMQLLIAFEDEHTISSSENNEEQKEENVDAFLKLMMETFGEHFPHSAVHCQKFSRWQTKHDLASTLQFSTPAFKIV